MDTRASEAMDSSFLDAAEQPFRMMVIYDSARAGSEAARASEVLLRELGSDVSVKRSNWNTQFFKAPHFRARAASEAARADVILLALSSSRADEELRDWTQQWEAVREQDGGLLALIPSGESETGGDLAEFLYETAISANMDFLCRKKRR